VLLFATLYLVFLVAGLVLWAAATATGLRENIEKFIGDLIASDDFKILGPTMMRASVLGGLIMVMLGTGGAVLFTVLYNLISDVIGGITIVFEERPSRRRRKAPVTLEPAADAPLKPARAARRSFMPRTPGPSRPDTTPMPDLPTKVESEAGKPVQFTRPSAD
jgi:predicted lipid-binding transport protein (Tim44 family)